MYLFTVPILPNFNFDSKYIAYLLTSIRNVSPSIIVMSVETRDKGTFEFLLEILPRQQ